MRLVRTKQYLKDLKRMRLSDEDAARLEYSIASDPLGGDVIPGLEGIRKIRFAIGNRGKRGGGRAIYYLMITEDVAVMLKAYAKSEQEDMSSDQKKAMLRILKELKDG